MIKFYTVKANSAYFYGCADKVREAKSKRERETKLFAKEFPFNFERKAK